MKAYIKTYSAREDGKRDSYATIGVDCRRNPMRHHKLGLSYTVTGYGKRIPTEYMIRFNDKWRRVYCVIYSNIGTLYIGKLSDNLLVDIDQ